MSVDITLSSAGALRTLAAALERAPRAVLGEVDKSIGRAATELGREAERLAPKADSVLANSIRPRRVTLGEWVVGTDTLHAGPTEEGSTGGGWVPLQSLVRWLQRKRITSRDPAVNQLQLARLVRWSIFRRGTPAQPFMWPALDALRPRIGQLLSEGAQRGVEAAFGDGAP